MSQESQTSRIHIKRRVELSFLQNKPSSAHNEPESFETFKKSVDISSLKEKYNIRLPRSYKGQTSAPQTVHFSEELESTISETVDELKTESFETFKKSVDISSLKEKYNIRLPRSYKGQTSAPQTVHFSEELESTISETVDELKTEFILVRSSPDDSGTELEIIPSKRPKGRKLKSKKIVKTNKGKRVFGNDSEEEDTESDDEKNEKGARNEMKTIIKTIDSEFSLNYN
ncbi:hypothetical protein Glove_122g157 [Diversispora epigaea]|uniref:Uncharacterized protein n=1 Tax=Diversispora epigaea TaxID=1348612 RepID=A0A397J8A1_9GLOM|nr:hypothetical protein Glove_122g157 [Diversispora epigaea]